MEAASRRRKCCSSNATGKRRRCTLDFPAVLYISGDDRSTAGFFAGTSDSLTPTETIYWSHKWAAKYAAQYHAPGNVARLLGVITRTWKVQKNPKKSAVKALAQPHPPKALPPTPRTAKTQLRQDYPHLTDAQASLQAESLSRDWKQVLQEPFSVGWNENGEFLDDGVSLKNLLVSSADDDRLLQALLDLSSPEGLYGIPLVTVQVRVSPDTITSENHNVQLGVYANRLLFECMTQGLKTILAALDPGSFQIKVPLQQPAALPEEPVFCSAPTPVLVFDSDDEDSDSDTENNNDDGFLQQGSREMDTLSAFSHAGLLRLWENHGCNVSNWPRIHDRLMQLQVQLLPHQQHGVCWMLQQEEYDLNALLWEKREFQDGGTYWYSPALGQVRLTLNTGGQVVRGGILADEMGLG